MDSIQYHKKEISFSFCFLLEMKLSEWLKLKLRACVRGASTVSLCSEHKETSVPLFWPSICLIYHHSPIIPPRSAFCSNQWSDLACDWQLIYSSEKGPLRSERPVPGQRRWEKYEKYVCTHFSEGLVCSGAKCEPISASRWSGQVWNRSNPLLW